MALTAQLHLEQGWEAFAASIGKALCTEQVAYDLGPPIHKAYAVHSFL